MTKVQETRPPKPYWPSDMHPRRRGILNIALLHMRRATNFQEHPNNQEIYNPPPGLLTSFDNEAFEFFDKIMLQSAPYLVNCETAGYINSTCILLLADSKLFRLFIASVMRLKRQFPIRYENRVQLRNVPAEDAKELNTLPLQRAYIRRLSPSDVFHDSSANFDEVLKDDNTLFYINFSRSRRENDAIFINLPVMVYGEPWNVYLHFVFIFLYQFVKNIFIFPDPPKGMEDRDIPELIALAIMYEWRYRDLDDIKERLNVRKKMIHNIPEILFLRPVMMDKRAKEILLRIADLAFQVHFYETIDGEVVDGEFRNQEYARLTLNLAGGNDSILTPSYYHAPWPLWQYRYEHARIQLYLSRFVDDEKKSLQRSNCINLAIPDLCMSTSEIRIVCD